MRPKRTIEHRSQGFTLIEMILAFTVLILILVGVLALFEQNGQVARAQTLVADMQQGLRVGQYNMIRNIRMAGRGGLPQGLMPAGLAVSVRNDAPASGNLHHIDADDTGSPEVLEGTDVLTIRGVLTTPIYQLNPVAGEFNLDDPTTPTTGSLTVRDPSPVTGVSQDTQPLIDAVNDGFPTSLILVSPVDDTIYAVVELNPTGPNTDVTDPTAVTVDFQITGGTHTGDYLALSPGGAFPAGQLGTVGFVGLLEEYRYYVKEEHAISTDPTTDLTPRLSRARFYPGTEEPYASDPLNLEADIADNVMDLQVALGINRDIATAGSEETIVEESDRSSRDQPTDEWLFNHENDDQTDASWNNELFYVRITSLARTDRRVRGHVSPLIDFIEDNAYNEADPIPNNTERLERMFRRRQLETIVDMRNL